MVTNLLRAPLLVLLTTVDGLFAGDPRTESSAAKLDTVPTIDAQILGMAGASKSSLGIGGMDSKLRAARLATTAGESVIMANGTTPGILDTMFAAEPAGTLFLPHGLSLPSWKRWLGFTARPKGRLTVDAGAFTAVREKGRSLLPIGVIQVQGEFHKGDVISLCDTAGLEFARGLTNYSAADARRVLGMRTEQIAEMFGTLPYEEIVHRDNLALLE
jgi:glutamate 5-kinase